MSGYDDSANSHRAANTMTRGDESSVHSVTGAPDRPSFPARLDLPAAEDALGALAAALFSPNGGSFEQLTWEDAAGRKAGPHETGDGRERVEARLRASELRYRTLIEQIPAVTFMAALGDGDNEIYVSPHIEALLGYTQQEWLSNPFLWYSRLHPDDRLIWDQEFARGVRTGGPFRAECRFIARDGRVVWVRGEARLVKDELGRPLFLQGVAFDVTESRQSHEFALQEAIRSTQQRYRDLVEQLGAIFWEADAATGRFTFVSSGAERILGFPRERWTSDPDFWIGRVHPDDRPKVIDTWGRALEGGGEQEFDFRAFTAQDEVVWLRATVRRSAREHADPYLLGIMTDVTERKRVDEERARLHEEAERARRTAEAAGRAKDEFLATMSHELRTPLNAMLGYAQLLLNKEMPEDLTQRALQSFERSARSQARLVDDLLDVSRIATGKLHLQIDVVDLAVVATAAIETVRLAADAKHLVLGFNADANSVFVRGDAARLQQVLWNLLSNAVKFTPEGGAVELRIERHGRMARITVADTGHGIDPTFLPHVFDRFRQADGGNTRQHGGLGLGLAIVRELVQIHGGTIQAHSEGIDCGTTFTIALPLLSAHPTDEAREGVRDSAAHHPGGRDERGE
jgi:PAS domain S-box-containing protein